MTWRTTLGFAIFALSSVAAFIVNAATGNCPLQSVVLRGEAPFIYGGGTYIETLTLTRNSLSDNMNGQWQLARFTSDIIYDKALRPPINLPVKKTLMGYEDRFMNCGSVTNGNILTTDCTGGNYTLDIWDNQIGLLANGKTIGKVSGRNFTMRFGLEGQQQMNPILTGVARDGPANTVNLMVQITSGEVGGDHVFSTASPGELKLSALAFTTPSSLVDGVVWDIPSIPGSQRTVTPASGQGSEITVTFTGLPASNAAFGKKQITASLEQQGCPIKESAKLSVFFPRDAKNHPEPNPAWPNWLYYWKQTKCGRPLNQETGVVFEASSPGCAAGTAGYYSYAHGKTLHSSVYICDLPAVLGQIMRTATPNLTYTPNAPTNATRFIDNGGAIEYDGIDTFGYTMLHEKLHYLNFARWWEAYGQSYENTLWQIYDKDQDAIPDTLEADMGFDKAMTLTYAPTANLRNHLKYDEHWLVYTDAQRLYTKGLCDMDDWALPGRNSQN